MGSMIHPMELLSRAAFGIASIVLMAMSLALVVYGPVSYTHLTLPTNREV